MENQRQIYQQIYGMGHVQLYSKITMGDSLSVQERQSFQQKLQFVMKNQSLFGCVDIFRFKEPPYEYIMDYQKTFIEGDTRCDSYFEFLAELRQKQHKNLAKLHLSEIRKETHMCIKETKVHTFCNYYNFTLRQGIDKKKVRDSRFSEPELMYIMSCLLDVAVFFKNCGMVIGDYRSDRIYLSPEGYIKVYSLEMDKNNRHTAYLKALTDKSVIQQLVLSPQQLISINKLDHEPKFDIFKSQTFAIGMIILELMTLDKLKFYYNQNYSQLKIGRILFSLSSLSSQYSGEFMELLRLCLQENYRDRISLDAANNRIEQLRKNAANVSYCIKLHEDDEAPKKKVSISTKGQYMLTGIEKRLTPSPITTMASSSSSGFASRYQRSNEFVDKGFR